MGVNLRKLETLRLDSRQSFERRDTMLYALAVGLGADDPCDARQLRFVYEDGLAAVPTMAITLAYPYPALPDALIDAGVNFNRVLHADQGFELHRSLPVEGTVTGTTRFVRFTDKGPDKGLILAYETEVRDEASGELVCTLRSSSYARGEGGVDDGPLQPAPPPHEVPTRPADGVCDLPTLRQAALLYRLTGDYNPLHVLPAEARRAGFREPILHGRCTFGVVGHALLRACCDYRPDCLRAMHARFSSPVYPGETIRTEYWVDGEQVSFRARVVERDCVVLDRGLARITRVAY